MRWGIRARRIGALTGLLVIAGFVADTGSGNAAMVHGNNHRAQPSSSPSPSTQTQYPTYTTASGNNNNHGNKHRKTTPTPTPTSTPTAAPKPAVRPASSPSAVSRGIPHSDSAYRAPSSAPARHAATTTTSSSSVPVAPANHRPDVASDHGPAGLLSAAFSNGVPKDGAFPAGLLIAAVVFLALQGRMDRSDAKLSLAEVATEDGLEFGAPPSKRRDAVTVVR